MSVNNSKNNSFIEGYEDTFISHKDRPFFSNEIDVGNEGVRNRERCPQYNLMSFRSD